MDLQQLAFNIQVLAIPPVAVLLWQLARAGRERYLACWAASWAVMSGALLVLRAATELEATANRCAFAAYCCLEYTAGFLLWAGCRALTRGAPVREGLWVLGAALVPGLVLPFALPTTEHAYAFHALVTGAFFSLALAGTAGYRAAGSHLALGIWVVRAFLFALGALFLHYCPVTYWAVFHNDGTPLEYMRISPLFDALAQVALALGMALVAIERVRDRLEAQNRELAEAYARLEVAARTDALTGLLNRGAYDAQLAAWAGTARTGAVALVDMNGLKALNDTHGHAPGDAAVQLVARALKAQFRITDPVYRLGGDEFLVLLEGATAAEMAPRLDALDEALKAQRLPGVAHPVDLVVAWGLADFASVADVPAAFDRADRAMYACKAARKSAHVARV
jgi:diguanylate cyclase (GGDEF)-like protein